MNFVRNIKAFSLVELMVSLIVISLVVAAFAPIITKKISSSAIKLGGANFSDLSVNCIDNCTLCQKDKCLLCASSYAYDKTSNTCINCTKKFNENTIECNASEALRCSKGYYIKDGVCTLCPVAYYCSDGKIRNKCSTEGYTSNEGTTKDEDCFPAFVSQAFTSSTTWTVPAGVRKLKATLIGGGSGGIDATSNTTSKEYRNPGNYEFDATGIDTIDFVMCGAGGTKSTSSNAKGKGGTGGYVSMTDIPTDKLKTDGNLIGIYIGGNSGTCTATIKSGKGGAAGSGGSETGWGNTAGGTGGTAGQSICGGSGGTSDGGRGGDATVFYAKYNEAGYFAPGGGGNGGNAWSEQMMNGNYKCHKGGGGGGGGGYGGGAGGNGAWAWGVKGAEDCFKTHRTNGSDATGASSTTVFGSGFCNSNMTGAMNISYTASIGGKGGASGNINTVEISVTPKSTLDIVIGQGANANETGANSYIMSNSLIIANSSGGSNVQGGEPDNKTGGKGAVATISSGSLCVAAEATKNATGYGCGGGGGTYPTSAGKGSGGYIILEKI